MSNKLELTWYGKDEPIRVEPRLLIENAALSNCAASPDTENILIHGDNLLALKALKREFIRRVKCVYDGFFKAMLPVMPSRGKNSASKLISGHGRYDTIVGSIRKE